MARAKAMRRLGRPALLAALLGLTTAPGQAETVLPGDLVTLQITEWRSVTGEAMEWPALRGPYPVTADGALDLPFIGRVPAVNRDGQALAQEIGNRLRQTLALTEQVELRLQITERAPVIVGGLARRPGAVDFLPGMTVRRAIALAGGLAGAGGEDTLPGYLSVSAQAAQLARAEGDLMLRIARLRAERDGQPKAVFPEPALLGPDGVARIADEAAILTLRHTAAARKVDLVQGRIALFSAEIATLQDKAAGLESQRALARAERDRVADLIGRGLAQSSRLLDAEQRLAAIESQSLDVGTATLRARQSLATAETELVQLDETRASDVLEALQRAETELADTRQRLGLQRGLIALMVPGGGMADAGGLVVTVSSAGGGMRLANWDSPLMPGDLVEIALPEGAGSDG